jgi:hypothetical protein
MEYKQEAAGQGGRGKHWQPRAPLVCQNASAPRVHLDYRSEEDEESVGNPGRNDVPGYQLSFRWCVRMQALL